MVFPSLSGSDYFHLLIDRKIQRVGLPGNISRIQFELDNSTDLEELASRLRSNALLKQVQQIRYRIQWPMLPVWTRLNNASECVHIHGELNASEFASRILNRSLSNETRLIAIDLCKLENGSKHMVISMHHVLFDFQGMMNFIHGLNGTFQGDLFERGNDKPALEIMRHSARMTVYLLRRSVRQLGSLLRQGALNGAPNYRTIAFSAAETVTIEKNAWTAGSRIGISSFLLSVIGRSVFDMLQKRNQKPPYLWFSVPHSQRKIGTAGHLVSNRLSFLFFKLRSAELRSIDTSVQRLNEQLKQQIRSRTVTEYGHLMDGMRRLPLWLYEQMVNVPSGGKLSSFGFSDLGSDQLQEGHFLGAEVKNIFRYPPIPTPPGFNVTAIRSHGQLILTLAYTDDALSPNEFTEMENSIRSLLLGVT